jgi:hypothetical protein
MAGMTVPTGGKRRPRGCARLLHRSRGVRHEAMPRCYRFRLRQVSYLQALSSERRNWRLRCARREKIRRHREIRFGDAPEEISATHKKARDLAIAGEWSAPHRSAPTPQEPLIW